MGRSIRRIPLTACAVFACLALAVPVRAAAPNLDWAAVWSRSSGGEETWGASLTDAGGNTVIAIDNNTGADGSGPGESSSSLIQFNPAGMPSAPVSIAWGSEEGGDIRALAADGSGGIIAAGYADRDGRRLMAASINPGTGAVNWVAYAQFSGGYALGNAVTVDSSGNVAVVGALQVWSGPSTLSRGIAVLFSPAGALLWSTSTTGLYAAAGVAADGFGNFYLAGMQSAGMGTDALSVARLDPGGTLEWSRTLAACSWNSGAAVVFDAGSNALFVSGGSSGPVTVRRLDPATGEVLSSGSLSVPFSEHFVGGMVRDGSGNIWITGAFLNGTVGNLFVAGFDSSLAPIPGSLRTHASGKDDGAVYAGGLNGPSRNTPLVGAGVDASGNVYLSAGAMVPCRSQLPGSSDIVVARFPASGPPAWVRTWDGPARVQTSGVVTDSLGRAIVAGQSDRWPELRMYSPSGVLIREARFTSTTYCDLSASSVSIHRASGTIVFLIRGQVQTPMGWSREGSLIAMYNGDLDLTALYGIFEDSTIVLDSGAMDAAGNLYVGGAMYSGSSRMLIAAKFGMGGPEWNVPLSTPGGDPDPGKVAVDEAGNMYLTAVERDDGGGGMGQGYIFKLDSSGNELWMKAAPVDVVLESVRADGASVYAAGYGFNEAIGIWGVISKLDGSGNTIWTREYHGAQPLQAFFGGIDLSEDGDPIASGIIGIYTPTVMDFDVHTVSYDPDGNLRWERIWDSGSGLDWATGTAMGSAYVSAQNGASGVLLKYTEPKARLAAALSVAPDPVGIGSWTDVVLTVTNTGLLDATAVTPALDINSGGALLSPIASPGPQGIPAGEARTFTWTLSANGSGLVRLTATAAGAEAGSGRPRSASASASLVTGVRLVSRLVTSPDASSCKVGEWFSVELTVTNTGGSAATGMLFASQINGGGATLAVVGAPPTFPGSLAAGASATVVWTYSVSASGTVDRSFTVTGSDSAGALHVAAHGLVTIVGFGSSNLSAALAISKATVGAPLTVWLTVTNTGAVAVDNAIPSADANEGGWLIAGGEGPFPPGPVTIGVGASQTFSWTLWTDAPGMIALTASVSGADNGSGIARVVAASGTTYIGPSPFVSALVADPPLMFWGIGMTTTLYMTVTNVGANAVSGVTPALQVNAGGAVLSVLAGPVPASLPSLAAGSGQVFKWIFSVVGSGNVSLSVTVSGIEDGSGATVAAIQRLNQPLGYGASWLAGNLTFSRWIENCGGSFTVWLTVTNYGNNAATNVTPWITPTYGSWRIDGLGPASPPGPQMIPPGGNLTFSWSTNTHCDTGNVSFSASVNGQDAGTGRAAAAGASGSMTIVDGPYVRQSLALLGNHLPVGSWVNLVLTLTNEGGIPLNSVTSYVQSTGCSDCDGFVELVSSPSGYPDLQPGSSQSFTWTFSVSGSGRVVFHGSSQGTDASDGNINWPWPQPELVFDGELVSALAIYPPADATNVGDIYAVDFTVTNEGATMLSGVTPNYMLGCCGTNVLPMSGPVPPGPISLAPGASQVFAWTFTVVGTGWASQQFRTDATDGTGMPVSTRKGFNGNVGQGASALTAWASVNAPVRGEMLLVSLSVSNSGTLSFGNLNPSLSIWDGNWMLQWDHSPPGGGAPIAPGETRVFDWTLSTTGWGYVDLSVTLNGQDNPPSGNWRTVGIRMSTTVYAPPPAVLSPSFTVVPGNPVMGDNLALVLTVSNTGGSPMNSVNPDMNLNGGWSLVSGLAGPQPNGGITIPAGGMATFTWTTTAIGVGQVQIYWSVNAWQEGPGGSLWTSSDTGFAISGPRADLTMEIGAEPDPGFLLPGEWFTIFMTVTNTGTAPVRDVLGLSQLNLGAGVLEPIVIPSATAFLVPGAGTTFAFTYSVSGMGTVSFTFTAAGIDNPSSEYISTAQTVGGPLGYGRPRLDMSIIASDVPLGGVQTIFLSVTNTGTAALNSVLPTLWPAGGSGAMSITGGPWPDGLATLPPGTSTSFAWTATAAWSGSVYLGAWLQGVSATSGETIGETVETMVMVAPLGRLVSALSSSPNPAQPGEWVSVVLTVSSTGSLPVQNVSPFVEVFSNSGNVKQELGPVPPGPVTLNPFQSQSFVWTYSVNGMGIVGFSATAMGTEQGTGLLRVTAQAGEMASGAHLVSALSFTPPIDWVLAGQVLTVALTVTNDGTNAANTVTPVNQLNAGASALSLLTGPLPAAMTLPAGSGTTFTWTYQVESGAVVDWTFTATGFDPIAGSSPRTVRGYAGQIGWGQAVLASAVSVPQAWVGQPLTALLTVTNTGNNAFRVAGAWQNVQSGGALLGGSPDQSPTGAVTIPAGSGSVFRYTWTPTGAGPVAVQFGVLGADEGSMINRMSWTVTGFDIVTPPPASLAAAVSVTPVPVATGAGVTVRLTVTNTGVVRVAGLAPSISFPSGGTCLSPAGPPSPAVDLLPGQSVTFAWPFDAVAEGAVALTASATGTDTTTGLPAGAGSAAAFPVMNQGAQFVVSLDVDNDPQALLPWDSFTVTLTVTNTGLNTATGVTGAYQVNLGASSLVLDRGPIPASIASLSTGAGGGFAWTFTVTSPGPISFTFTAMGTDSVTLGPVLAALSGDAVVGYGEAELVASLTVTGGSVGQPVWVSFTVSNAGNNTATVMTPSLVIVQGAGLVSWLTGPSVPGPLALAPLGTTTIVWSYMANSVGFVRYSVTLAGWDAGSGLPRSVNATAGTSIGPAARLTAQLTANPPAASVGDWVDVVLRITNIGGLAAFSVTGYLDVNLGAGLLDPKGSPAGTQDIPAGASRFFTWTYSVNGSGTVAFTGTGAGTEAGSGTLRTASAQGALFGQLVSALSIAPPLNTLVAGQWFQARLTVTNTGVDPVSVVMPWAQVNTGSAILTQIGAVSPAGPLAIPAGGAQTFAWTYSSAGAGSVSLSFTATGTDAGSNPVATARWATGSVGYGAGALTAWMSVTATRTGGVLTVTLSASNSGNNTVGSVVPSILVMQGASLLAARSGPSPAGPFTLAPGAVASVEWTYTATGPGPVSFEGTMAGADNGSDTPRSAVGYGNGTILPPPARLTAVLAAFPPVATVGQQVWVILSITNTGGVSATGVGWAVESNTGGGLVTPVQGPVPAGPITLPAGAGFQVYWTFTATAVGTVAWTATASGTDSAGTGPVSASGSDGITILAGATLVASVTADPGPASTGMWTRVHMSVTNTGSAAANAVIPALEFNSGGALVSVVGAPSAQTIPVGGNRTFSWTLSVNGGGIVAVTATATGADAGSGMPVSASASGGLTTASGATLAASLAVSPSSAAPGQWIQVRLTVTNTGIPAANSVVPAIAVTTGASLVVLQPPVSPSGPQTIAGGSALTFVWTFSVSGTGAVGFTATASGFDAVTAAPTAGSASGGFTGALGAILVASGAISPSSPSVGQWAIVTLTVTNVGAANATGVTPAGQVNLGGALVVEQGSVTPPSVPVLAPGSAATFTWTFSVSGAGVVSVTATATGTDAATAGPVAATATTGGTLRAASSLVAALSTGPSTASVGTWIRVALTVTNTGGVNANAVTPVAQPQVNAGAAAVVFLSGPVPAGPVTLSPATAQTFVWTYSVSGAGTVSWTATAAGTDSGTGSPRVAAATGGQSTVAASALVAALSVSPPTASIGNWVTIALTVTNTGGVNANAVTPVALPQWNAGGGLVAYQNGPTPAGPVALAPGAAQTFVWTYSVSGAGVATMSATATGTDIGTGFPVRGAASGVLAVGANLVSILAIDPSPASVGQQLRVRLTVTNTGGVNATGVGPYISVNTGGGLVTPVTVAAGSLTVAPGSGTTFEWIYTVAGAGTVGFTVTSVGTDSSTGNPIVTAKTQSVSLLAAASLAGALSTGPSTASVGTWIRVALTVTNTGGVNADAVTPVAQPQVNAGAAAVVFLSGPVPAGPVTLSPAAAQAFVWTYSVSGAGTVSWTATAAGTDSGTGSPRVAAATAGQSTLAGATLASALSVSPPTASVGQWVTLALTVTNTGGVNANAVTPVALPQWNAGGGLVAYQNGPTPAGPVALAPGAAQTFVWTYSVSGAGVATMTATATGTDAGTGFPVVGAASGVLPVGAYLVSTLAVTPSPASVGQQVRVRLTVSNTGGVNATGVGPFISVNAGGALVTPVTVASWTVPVMAPGSGTTFEWIYSVAGAGAVEFTATSVGTDSGTSGALVTAKTQAVSLLAASSLAAALSTGPAGASVGTWIRVALTVTNTGGVAANSVSPFSQVDSGGALVAQIGTVAPPGPVTLAAGASQTFVWTWSVSGAGAVSWTATAVGSDSGTAAVRVAAVTAGQSTLAAAALVASVRMEPSPASVGQWVTVLLSVTNTGGVSANSVTPAIQLNVGGTRLAALTSPSAATIGAGVNSVFVWTYSASGAGAVNLTATGTGTDAGTGRAVSASGSAGLTILASSSLVSALSVVPSTATTPSVGQSVEVRLTVTNSGGVAVNALTPQAQPQVNAGAGLVSFVSGPTPAGGTLNAGASATYAWTYNVTGAGTVSWTATALGTDAGTGLDRVAAGTKSVTTLAAASLAAYAAAYPSPRNIGQGFLVTLTVTNAGGVGISPFSVGLPLSTGGAATQVAGPFPTVPGSLAGGASLTFTWTFTGPAAGAVALSMTVAGLDSNTAGALSALPVTGPVTIQQPAALDAAVVAFPAQVSVGQAFSVTVTVTNTGGAGANSVAASAPAKASGAGNAVAVSGPVPAGPVALAGGAAQTFVWTYSATAGGALVLSSGAAGTDANSGGAVTSGSRSSNSVTVQAAAVLTGTFTVPAVRATGQGFVVTLRLFNTGTADATGTLAALPFNNVSGTVTADAGLGMFTDGPYPAMPFTITGGNNRIFTWTYTGSTAGAVYLSTTVTASDANSGAAIGPIVLGAMPLVLIDPSSGLLTATSFAVPSGVTKGDRFTVSVTIRNFESGSATITGASLAQVGGSGSYATVSGPTPAGSVVLGPAGSAVISWQLEATGEGAVVLQATVNGVPLPTSIQGTVEIGASGTAVTVAQGKMLVAPNLLDLGKPGASVTFYGRGTPGGTVEVRIYDAAGGYMGQLPLPLDATGFGSVVLTGNKIGGVELGSGVYWALPTGGGVAGRKPFMVQGRKK